MAEDISDGGYDSFLGTGWSFPPQFVMDTGTVVMTPDEADIEASLKILLATAAGERFLNPKYGLDLHELLFEPMSTTMLTFLKERVKTALLIYEPRIDLLALNLDTSAQAEGKVAIEVEYRVRATNSRFNMVYEFYPFSTGESSEASTEEQG